MAATSGSMVKLAEGVDGYLAKPSGTGKYPGVVVIHEIFGLVEHIKDVTRRLASEGFVGLAADLFNGKTASTVEDGRKIRAEISDDAIASKVRQGLEQLRGRPEVRGDRVAIMGFCMGGGVSLMAGCRIPEFTATVVFYGRIQTVDEVRNLQGPVLGIFGELDKEITAWAVNELAPAMQRHGKTFQYKVYPDAPHAFFNDTRLDRYRPEAAKDAWKLTLDFLNRSLK